MCPHAAQNCLAGCTNYRRIWSNKQLKVLMHKCQVAGNLRIAVLDLYERHLAEDGSAVDYKGLRRDPAFADYVNATAELQQVDLAAMSEPERKVRVHGKHYQIPLYFSRR